MCLARVRFVGDEEDESPDVLSDVAWIERTPAGLRVADLSGNVTDLDAEIRSIDFMSSVVQVEERGATGSAGFEGA